ncbi:NADPH2 dehydrogenase [Natronobacillus azotifigens]|uniref:NADPH dehydrogenase NamA n=1 Tax=Natronobacillus azotifigens TaxID=472978 RepID=A0A9J6R944_9BACI|nr:NADPH dehydrogenase NamA [Natronobacillus azotifigens]MCZ0701801.1 NADPH dehydrogenase NamA [Natronobacillus azotifigens]
MERKLFTPITFKDVTLKNRIVMSPMCILSTESEDGQVNPFHITHYESRAVGQVGLIMVEATAVQPEGRIMTKDLGIWSDEHIEGLQRLNERIHAHGSKSSIQLAHAGRKANTPQPKMAPSSIREGENETVPTEMSDTDIKETIKAFQMGAKRAKKAGFDIIELHAAHGYLINQFLSPLSNKRDDEYGGSRENRYRLLREIIEGTKKEFTGPIFVRISADEYHQEGNQMEDFVYFSKEMKKQGISLIDVSTGGIVLADIQVYPGYQVKHAETIKKAVEIPTGAVGLITSGVQAEEILQNERADLIFLGRVLLRKPYWAKEAADELNFKLDPPKQYQRGWY